eukprot:PhF_6_TR37642/c0_g1_i1/m.56003
MMENCVVPYVLTPTTPPTKYNARGTLSTKTKSDSMKRYRRHVTYWTSVRLEWRRLHSYNKNSTPKLIKTLMPSSSSSKHNAKNFMMMLTGDLVKLWSLS